jgi:hypothetical protein
VKKKKLKLSVGNKLKNKKSNTCGYDRRFNRTKEYLEKETKIQVIKDQEKPRRESFGNSFKI